MGEFSLSAINAIAEVVTGGSGAVMSGAKTYGRYRSGPELGRLFASLDTPFSVGGSRVPSVRSLLTELNKTPEGQQKIAAIIEKAVDFLDYFPNFTRGHIEAVEYLRPFLRRNGCDLEEVEEHKWAVVPLPGRTLPGTSLKDVAQRFSLESVERDLERATKGVETDPESAITSACATVESVCKCILDEMKKPYPTKQDIQGLVGEVTRQLNLHPSRTDLPAHAERDIKQVLSGLISVAGGIGALRTHSGTAHGQGKTRVPVDARIARLAVNAASTLSHFLIETWRLRNAT